jgi:predicted O-linked N-acetylglucosamine transferase (SPINDLY family)
MTGVAKSETPIVDAAEAARALRKKANELVQLGQHEAALNYFERALACNPDDPNTLNDRGNSLQDLQRYAEAVASYDAALRIKRELPATLNNRGNALRKLGRLEEALRDLDAALRIRPTLAEALNSRGNVLRDLGRLEEALSSFEAALALKPEFVLAHCNRGNTLLDLGQPGAAFTCFDALLKHLPDDGEALYGRASALLRLQESLELAVADFAKAADRGIDRAESLVGAAAALAELQRHAEAAECLAELLEIAPEREYARGSLMHSRLQICNWSDLSARTARIIHDVRESRKTTYPSALLSLTDLPDLQLQCARAVVEDKYRENTSLGPFAARPRQTGRRLRVVYVSADFREHPVSHLLVGVLERHDRDQFEVIGVSLRPGAGGAFERRVRGAFDRFIEVADRSDREVAQLLRELEVDIAVDLMGFTQGLRLGIFAYRCAPVQVSYLGYAGTTGAPYMDYLLADEVVIPAAEEAAYSERIIRLPHCYLPNDDRRPISAPPSRAQAGLPEQGLVLYAFTNAYKITPAVFEIWMRLLRELPGSVLWLRAMGAEAQSNLQREAQARGVRPERLIFAPRVAGMAEHLGRQTLADLYLDTLPYNAHSTTCDALWAGVPVLTCTGRSFASRVAASALRAVGLPELITHTLEEYERKALELGRDPQRLRQLRAKLAQQRSGSPLFDTTACCRNLENAFQFMYNQKVGGGLDDAESLHQLGVEAMRNGQIDVGIELMQRCVQADPARPTVLLNLARALTQAGRREAAVAAYDRALAARPSFAEAHYGLGNAYMVFHEPNRALESYERLLALDPAHAAGWSNRGNALQGLGRLDEAVESYDRALALRADVALTHYNRANALRSLGQFEAALKSYDRALGLNPRLAEAHNNRGLTLRALAKPDEEALAAFDRAIALKPRFVEALIERGNVLRDTQRPDAALESYGRALAVEPECVESLCNRGSVLVDLKRYAEALESYDRAVALDPDSADILAGRATALEEMSLHENAAASLERLLQVSPQHDYALGRLLQARLNGCAWDEYSELLTRATTELAAGRRVVHPFLALVAMPSATLQLRAAQLLAPDGNPAVQPPARKTGRSRSKLRLAYVSADFREHAASYLLAGVFERHDRNLFETIAISLLPPHDSAMGRRVYAGFDRFVDVSRRTNADVVALMREMEIDVAVDLMGYTHFGRPGIFAHRAAPIQVSYLGHPGTLGVSYIDYILADEFLIPQESAAHYTERVVYLPECFQANDDRCVVGPRPTRPEAGLPREGLVFCCFNSSFKLNPAIFDIWMRLLRAVPNSTLWLLADRSATQQNLLREAAARGVDASRLVFAEKLPYAQHLGRLGLADMFLDTFPYNAGASASDALRTGVPVLTCAGEPLASRMAGSLLTTVGLPELITYTLEDYESKAVELANDPRLFQALRARLAGNLRRTPLFDTARFCQHLEAAYLQMHERVTRGEGPASFSVAKRG